MPEKRCIHQQWSIRGVWYRMSDALCIVAGLAIAVGGGLTTRIDHYIIAAAVAIIVYGLAAETGDMYRSWRGVSVHREAIGTLLIWGFTCAILLALGFATKHTHEFCDLDVRVVCRHSGADRRRPIGDPLDSADPALVGLPHAGSSPSSGSMNWVSSWRETSRPRPRWGSGWQASSTIVPRSAVRTFPPNWATVWARSRTWWTRPGPARSTASTSRFPCAPKIASAACWTSWATRPPRSTSCPTSSSSNCSIRVGPTFWACRW